ncbi:hypothetical protein Adt_15254 [Abeliophyllum distichum]|uniref:Uncharacterized protein n=1 Tax=Abeliophyllum distichum TaxID=126358 RepID=A0ABD1U200_9LAMI
MIRQFPNAWNGCIFMIEAVEEDPYKFQIYPPMFVNFTHLLHDEYELHDGPSVDVYKQVGKFLFILAHEKSYRQGYRQTAVVVAIMEIDNFLHNAGQVDGAFQTVDEVVDAADIDLPYEPEETSTYNFVPHVPNTEWDQLWDHIA